MRGELRMRLIGPCRRTVAITQSNRMPLDVVQRHCHVQLIVGTMDPIEFDR